MDNNIDKSKTLDNNNDNDKNTNNIQEFMDELRPLYPPLITPELLMPKLLSPTTTITSKKSSGRSNNKRSNIKFPNAFIAYRMEFCKQLRNKRMCLTMQDVSYFASKLWKQEPCDVKKTYTRLANDAKLLYEKRKKELLLAEEQRRQENQIEQQQKQQFNQSNSNSTDVSLNSLNLSSFQELRPSQELKESQQILPLQNNLIETTTISSQPQIPSQEVSNPTLSFYNFPAVDSYNVFINNLIPPSYSEDFNVQPSILPPNYFAPTNFY